MIPSHQAFKFINRTTKNQKCNNACCFQSIYNFEVKGREEKTHLKFWPKYIAFVSFFCLFLYFYNVCFCHNYIYCIVYNKVFRPQACQILEYSSTEYLHLLSVFSKTYYRKYSGNQCVIYGLYTDSSCKCMV